MIVERRARMHVMRLTTDAALSYIDGAIPFLLARRSMYFLVGTIRF